MLEYEPVMRKLLKKVVRSFYEPHHVVIVDILLENVLLNDAEFSARMKMLSREFNKLIIRLKDDRLVKADIKVESKEDNKQILRNVYFFNYAEARDVIKYKIFKMTKALEIKRVSDDEAFYCPVCEKYYSALDAQALVEAYVFKCITCRTDLQECTHKSNERGVDLREMLLALDEIISLLKAAEKYEIPSMDYFQVLELKKEKAGKEVIEEDETRGAKSYDFLNVEKPEKEGDWEDFSVGAVQESRPVAAKNEIVEMVEVNGHLKPFSEITEEDKEMMNEEEYTRYFEIYTKYN